MVGWLDAEVADAEVLMWQREPYGPITYLDNVIPFVAPVVGGFIPYPNPRYSMAGGMQVNTGGMN